LSEVVASIIRTWVTEASGCMLRIRATSAATYGEAIEVPLALAYWFPVQVESTATPGADTNTSGLP
jgi:hypothetical protein